MRKDTLAKRRSWFALVALIILIAGGIAAILLRLVAVVAQSAQSDQSAVLTAVFAGTLALVALGIVVFNVVRSRSATRWVRWGSLHPSQGMLIAHRYPQTSDPVANLGGFLGREPYYAVTFDDTGASFWTESRRPTVGLKLSWGQISEVTSGHLVIANQRLETIELVLIGPGQPRIPIGAVEKVPFLYGFRHPSGQRAEDLAIELRRRQRDEWLETPQ